MTNDALRQLLQIPDAPGVLFPRGGAYNPALNVWVCHEFRDLVAASSPEQIALWEALATLAIAAGALHRQQILDSKAGKLWPQSWIEQKAGNQLVTFCQQHPEAATPYVCLTDQQEILPYSIAYRDFLAQLTTGLDLALGCPDPSAQQQRAYLQALRTAYQDDPQRSSDLDFMNTADMAWVEIPGEVPLLLLCEFTESYSDPIKRLVDNQPVVTQWAQAVAAAHGLGPWRFFFEFRVLALVDTVLTPEEIAGIRATNRRLYADYSTALPSANVKTEFRRAVITGGHGANPPKSAKNYPNQEWIRSQIGYRNIIFANQVEEKVKREVIPALRAAFATPWAQADQIVETVVRANALVVVAHEETHPWVTFPEVSWLEELKSTILGMYSIVQNPAIVHDVADGLICEVASALLLHRYHHYLLRHGDSQFEDYYIGDTIFLTYLWRGGFFQVSAVGEICDVNREKATELLVSFAHRIQTIKRGQETPLALYEDLFADAQIYDRFIGWAETQPYFESIWSA